LNRLIRCECGFIARSDTDDKVIAKIREHMGEDHPALLNEVSVEDLRSWIEID